MHTELRFCGNFYSGLTGREAWAVRFPNHPNLLPLTPHPPFLHATYTHMDLPPSQDFLQNNQGTMLFSPPEACRGQAKFSGTFADVWALGVTLFAYIYGHTPFTADTRPGPPGPCLGGREGAASVLGWAVL